MMSKIRAISYLELSLSRKLKREPTEGQSEDLLVAIVHSRMGSTEGLVNLFDCGRHLRGIEDDITD